MDIHKPDSALPPPLLITRRPEASRDNVTLAVKTG
jgi:hypothetical protein